MPNKNKQHKRYEKLMYELRGRKNNEYCYNIIKKKKNEYWIYKYQTAFTQVAIFAKQFKTLQVIRYVTLLCP